LSGRIDIDWFLARMRDYWYGRPSGLSRLIEQPALERALARFVRSYAIDPREATATLVDELLRPSEQQSLGWVEQTPPNCEAAGTLRAIFPDARFVHVVRSGLDVACSYRERGWAPDDLFDCLLWWEERLARADRSLREVPPERVLTLHLEDLVSSERRDSVFERLSGFLGAPGEPTMRRFFDTRFDRERAQVGRWRDLQEPERSELGVLYAHVLHRLRRRGVTLPRDAPGWLTSARSPWPAARAVRRTMRWRLRRRRPWNRKVSRRWVWGARARRLIEWGR
jgi:hypothetical protein